MSKHLGRNPFQKKKTSTSNHSSHFSKDQPDHHPSEPSKDNTSKKKLSDSLLIKIPTESVMLALKTAVFVKTVINKRKDGN